MTISFATKRNTNGNRAILIIDSDAKTYATSAARWYCNDDYIEVSRRDLIAQRNLAINAGYKQIENALAGFKY